MRLSARFAAPLLALVAFAVPATVPAHAANLAMTHAVHPVTNVDAFAPSTVAVRVGDVLTVFNAPKALTLTTTSYTYVLRPVGSPTGTPPTATSTQTAPLPGGLHTSAQDIAVPGPSGTTYMLYRVGAPEVANAPLAFATVVVL